MENMKIREIKEVIEIHALGVEEDDNEILYFRHCVFRKGNDVVSRFKDDNERRIKMLCKSLN